MSVPAQPNSVVCKFCKKEFSSANRLNSHLKIHSPLYEEGKIKMAVTVRKNAIDRYNEHPVSCGHCNIRISYEVWSINNYVKFCSHRCSATSSNSLRGARTSETKERISNALKEVNSVKHRSPNELLTCGRRLSKRIFKSSIAGVFSKIYRCRCRHCDLYFIGGKRRKYCASHTSLYLDAGRNVYEFTINPFKFPDIFSAATLQDLRDNGFWSPSNRNGLTRDHKVSVNEAIKHSYPPHYIKHPLNCEIMSWQENNVKKARSSMSYDDLKKAVDEYEAKKFQL